MVPFLHHAPAFRLIIDLITELSLSRPQSRSRAAWASSKVRVKSIAFALASILATTAAAWAAPAQVPPTLTLTHRQLVDIVHHVDGDPNTIPGFIGAHLDLDLRQIPKQPYFVAAKDPHGIAFTCQVGFGDFGCGPVAATLVSYERGEDARDFVKLDACTPQER